MAKPGQSSIYLREETLHRLRIASAEESLRRLKAGDYARASARTMVSYDMIINMMLDDWEARNG